MRFMIFLCIALPSLLFAQSGKITVEELEEQIPLAQIATGPCPANCPVFSVTIYETRWVRYEGLQFTSKLGTYAWRLSKEEYQQIVDSLESVNLWQFQSLYKSERYDMATVTITHYADADIKTVVGKENRPDEVQALERFLRTKFDTPVKDAKLVQPHLGDVPMGADPELIVVHLLGGLNAKEWVGRYDNQKLEVIKPVNQDNGLWLLTYDLTKNRPGDIISLIRRDPQVVGAEFKLK